MKKLIAICVFLLMSGAINAQDLSSDINITLSDDKYDAKTEFFIKNINGNVTVTGYSGNEIVITGTKRLWKKNGSVSNDEAAEIRLETKVYEGNLYVYVDAPGAHAEFYDGKMDYHWHWDDDNYEQRIRTNFDLEIKVPKSLALSASTVNGGKVFVEGMRNGVSASNVNGSVLIKDISGPTSARTVNGSIEAWMNDNPETDTNFKTVNGKIEVFYPKNLDAVVTFDGLHGELYTDFEKVKTLPNRVSKEEDGDGFRIKIDKVSPIQIGDGGPEISFKTVNGSAYIRAIKS